MLESSIDKAPYVNVMEDGMVATVGNDSAAQDVTEEDVDRGESQTPLSNTPAFQQDEDLVEQRREDESHSALQLVQSEQSEKSTRQISRRNTWSIWLLAYIAIATTWPLVGSTILTVLKKRFKRGLPLLSRFKGLR